MTANYEADQLTTSTTATEGNNIIQSVVSYGEWITEIEFRIIRKPSIVPRRRRYYKWYPSLFPGETPWKYLQNAFGTPLFKGFSQLNQQNTLF